MSVTKLNISKIVKEINVDPHKYASSTSINSLVKLLKFLSDQYYKTNSPLVSDITYDILRDVLEERDPNNKYLNQVGYAITTNKVELPFSMPSLNKIKPTTEYLKTWKSSFKGPYTVSDKLDGVSALLYKANDKFFLYTRGNAIYGRNISHLIDYIFGAKIKKYPIVNGTAIRGELIISKKNFKSIEKEYKNVRNTVAGLVNSKKVNIKIAKITDFIAYSIVNPNYTHINQLQLLNKWTFPVINVTTKKIITNEALSKHLQSRRESSDYDIDGIVVVDGNVIYEPYSGNPDYAFAFKMVLSDQMVEVIVIGVDWNVSRHGYIKPTVQINPVEIGGVTIKNATAFNAKYVKDNKLGPGSIIKLVRSGDVIPHIVEVKSPSSTNKPMMPSIPYQWTSSGVDVVIKDGYKHDTNDAMVVKQIANFFSVIGVRDISEGIVAKLVSEGYTSIFKVLDANTNDLINIGGIGDKLVDKIYKNIDSAFKKVTLEQLMAASNTFGRGFGLKKIKLITVKYPNILNEDLKTLKGKIIKIEGFDEKTASKFVEGLPKFIIFLNKLRKIKRVDISNLDKRKIKKTGVKFQGMKIVFTGFRDSKLEEYVTRNGGSISSTVSKNTTLVVYKHGAEDNSKYIKAKELKVNTVLLETFMKKYKLAKQ